jgi:chitin synthase
MFLSVWKMAVLLCGVLLMLMLEGTDPANLFLKFSQGFGPHKIIVEEIATSITQLLPDIAEATHVSFC